MAASLAGRWADLDRLLLRQGNLVGPGYEPGPELLESLQNDLRVLVIGAGGLGCELLKDLALSGFGHIDVIDMDTIDVSNLNRQFLFRMKDVGKPKAEVAAERVMQRVKGVTVVPHFCRIEEKDVSFYQDFQIIVLGLDSLEARSYINSVVCGFLEYEEDGSPNIATIKPLVDGGTEGFKGHARVIFPGITPCFHCSLWLFPPQVTFPLCTLAETPRSPAHCIEYAHLIQWGQDRQGESFDADNPEHMKWIYDQAIKRGDQFNITGITYSLTQGVVKNIVPAIASTNAIVAATCALETLKIATMCSTGMEVYMQYTGTEGIYMRTVPHDKDPNCIICSPGVPVEVDTTCTLQKFIDQLLKDSRFKLKLSKPSVSYHGDNLYMQAPPVLEEMTRPNLSQPLLALMDNKTSGVLNINDRRLTGVLRLRVTFKEGVDSVDMDTAGGG
jgi:ubiquitin-activating enzyme E1 C